MSVHAVDTPVSSGTKITIITCNDLHLADKPPASRRDNYIDEVFGLLDQIAALAIRQHAQYVCIAGDIFHLKDRAQMDSIHRLAQWCLKLKARGIFVLTIPGNHDLRYDRYESLEKQPLGLFYALGLMQNVTGSRDGGTPWVHGFWHFLGIPFPDAMDLAQWQVLGEAVQLPNDGRRVVLAHCFASASGGDVYGEPEHAYHDLYMACPASLYVFGHDHSHGGVARLEHLPHKPVFVNLGAVCRGSIAHDDINRDIRCGLITLDSALDAPHDVKVQQVKLNYIPADQLFDLEAKATADAARVQIESFASSLQDTLAALGTSRPLDAHMAVLPLSDEVRARMLKYLHDVEHANAGR